MIFFKKIHRILTGFYLLFLGSEREIEVKRRLICKDCELRKGVFCGECGCFINAKVQVDEEECPVGKW